MTRPAPCQCIYVYISICALSKTLQLPSIVPLGPIVTRQTGRSLEQLAVIEVRKAEHVLAAAVAALGRLGARDPAHASARHVAIGGASCCCCCSLFVPAVVVVVVECERVVRRRIGRRTAAATATAAGAAETGRADTRAAVGAGGRAAGDRRYLSEAVLLVVAHLLLFADEARRLDLEETLEYLLVLALDALLLALSVESGRGEPIRPHAHLHLHGGGGGRLATQLARAHQLLVKAQVLGLEAAQLVANVRLVAARIDSSVRRFETHLLIASAVVVVSLCCRFGG